MADVRDDQRNAEAAVDDETGRMEPHGQAEQPTGSAVGGEGPVMEGEQEAPLPDEGSGPAERLAEAETEIARLKDEHLRALAEVENVRRRAARDKSDATKYAVTGFARDLLPVADNLRRAVDMVDADARKQDQALEALVAGLEMTEKALLGVFERYGIMPIEADGKRFDPHVHEAMFEIPNESVPHGTVLQVLERGYMIHDRPLRPARVGVSRGGPKSEGGAPPGSSGAGGTRAEETPAGGESGKDESNVEPFPRDRSSAYLHSSDKESEGSGSRYDERH